MYFKNTQSCLMLICFCCILQGEEPNNTEAIFEKEKNFYRELELHLPSLTSIPIYNE